MAADSDFTKKRGAERMRQSFARAYAAGLSQGDRDVLHAVHVETTGQTKITNRITHAQIAYHLKRLERVESEDDLDERERNRRERVKERIGKSLERLHAVGAIEYEPGRGGRLSRITLPAVDDSDNFNPTQSRGVDEVSTPRGETLNPTRRRGSTPRGHVVQPHAATWGLPMETDRSPIGSDRARHANGDRPARSSTSSPTTADAYDDQRYADFIDELVELHYPGRRNPAQPADVLAAARTFEHASRYWPDHVAAVVSRYATGRASLKKPSAIIDELREDLLADGIPLAAVERELIDPGPPSSATS